MMTRTSCLRSVLGHFSSSCRVSETSESAQERSSQCLSEGLVEDISKHSKAVKVLTTRASFCVLSTAWVSNASWSNDAWTILPRAEISTRLLFIHKLHYSFSTSAVSAIPHHLAISTILRDGPSLSILSLKHRRGWEVHIVLINKLAS